MVDKLYVFYCKYFVKIWSFNLFFWTDKSNLTILKKNFLTYYKNLHKHKNNNFNIYNLDKIKTKKIKLLKK